MTSITGIIIALGLLIDNGIIVVEDYKFRRSQGLSIKDSINETLIQLTTPLAAATGTTVCFYANCDWRGIKCRVCWRTCNYSHNVNCLIAIISINFSTSFDELYGKNSLL